MNVRSLRVILPIFIALPFLLGTAFDRPAAESHVPHPVLGTEILLADWGFKDVSEIRAGQIGVIHEKKDRLDIYRLRKVPPVRPAASAYRSRAPEIGERGVFLVSHYDEGNQNSLGGYYNVYQRAPSSALCGIEATPDGRRALALRYSRAATGFCGLWTHFYNLRDEPDSRVFLNAEPFSELAFWVRGEKGGENIYLKISDANWDRKEDALPIGPLEAFVEGGEITTEWRLARVPLTAFPDGIRRDQLAGLILDASREEQGSVYLKTLAFVTAQGKPPPLRAPHPSLPPQGGKGLKQATWVWETSKYLKNPAEQNALLQFMMREKIDHLFLQIPNEPDRLDSGGASVVDAGRMRPFLGRLNRKGVKVHAMDGWTRFALPEYHDTVLATMRNVIRYNRESDTIERFYAFHYDIEPYLNSGFGGYRRDWILQNFLLILKKSRDLAHAAGLPYGCDVPFWFDSPDEFTNEKFIVEFGGQRKLVSDHLIDLVDNVGIMDYRTVAYGADGVIAHAGGELEYAAKAGKPIFVGLETFGLPDETQWSFRTDAQAGLPVLAAGTFLFARASGDSGAFYYVPEGGLDTFVAWTKTRRIDPAALRYWRLKEKIFVPSSKVTFAGMPADRLKLAMEQARFELSKIPSFAGFAIHYYETYRDLLSPVKR